MRKGCIDCAIKHVAQAQVLLDEAQLGYPNHRWLAVGHLAEAESELLGVAPLVANDIRGIRITVASGLQLDYEGMLQVLLNLKDQEEQKTIDESYRKDKT